MRKYEKTIDVKTAIESVLALFVVEKMSRSSVRDRPLASFFLQKGLSVQHETKLGLEIRKLFHVFLFHFYQMLNSASKQKSFVIAKVI